MGDVMSSHQPPTVSRLDAWACMTDCLDGQQTRTNYTDCMYWRAERRARPCETRLLGLILKREPLILLDPIRP